MNGPLSKITVAASAGVAALLVAGCGSSNTSSLPSGLVVAAGVQTPANQPQTCAKRGGTLKVLDHEDFEHIDPGQSYAEIDYPVIYATQRPLYTYRPNSLKEIAPDLAESMPQISPDRKTITIHIRHGVRFSP
jgi:peptide/nickel transport system substrate-binding protein